jgi:alpha-L-arabinofuranosidase
LAFLLLTAAILSSPACALPGEKRRGIAKSPTVRIIVDPSVVQRTITRQILGQGVFYSWQAYAWDFACQRTWPGAMLLFKDLGMGVLGHYPGVGVITHDFHWKNMIGPLDKRKDPTPRQASFDTPQHLEFGPDEYGRLVEEYRLITGRPVEGSIQVNIVNGAAEEAADWVEYMNAPNDGSNKGGGIDWAAVRAANGHSEPYRICYWELGNEPHFTASKIGHLTAAEYIDRIREFVPLMKERDPSIKVMAYVNPFEIGDAKKLGTATADILVGPKLTWSQAIIKDAGSYLDHVYFHWYGGWNDRRHDYEFFATSMHTGLVTILNRLMNDIKNFASSDADRTRLQRVFIPEWNVYGGWAKPLSKGTAIQGAVAYSRTLHVFASRGEIYSAQHLGLTAPYPGPRMKLGFLFDIREGYFTIRAKEDETDFMGTALYAMAKLWSRAFAPDVVPVSMFDDPAFKRGVSVVDVTALRSAAGNKLNIIITNAGYSPLDFKINVNNFAALPNAIRLTVSGTHLSANNDWKSRNNVILKETSVSLIDANFTLTIPAHSIEAVLMERARKK